MMEDHKHAKPSLLKIVWGHHLLPTQCGCHGQHTDDQKTQISEDTQRQKPQWSPFHPCLIFIYLSGPATPNRIHGDDIPAQNWQCKRHATLKQPCAIAAQCHVNYCASCCYIATNLVAARQQVQRICGNPLGCRESARAMKDPALHCGTGFIVTGNTLNRCCKWGDIFQYVSILRSRTRGFAILLVADTAKSVQRSPKNAR